MGKTSKKGEKTKDERAVRPAYALGIQMSPAQVAKQIGHRFPHLRLSKHAVEAITIAVNVLISEPANTASKHTFASGRKTLTVDDVQHGIHDKNDQDIRTVFDGVYLQGTSLKQEEINEEYFKKHFEVHQQPQAMEA